MDSAPEIMYENEKFTASFTFHNFHATSTVLLHSHSDTLIDKTSLFDAFFYNFSFDLVLSKTVHIDNNIICILCTFQNKFFTYFMMDIGFSLFSKVFKPDIVYVYNEILLNCCTKRLYFISRNIRECCGKSCSSSK
jgi:hypothetical protein